MSALDVLMSREYRKQALEVFTRTRPVISFAPTLGLEMEYSVVGIGDTNLIDERRRDKIVAEIPLLLGQELGAAQIEVRTAPVDLASRGLSGLETEAQQAEANAARAAAKHNAALVRIGSFPLQRVDQVRRSSSPRYNSVVDWHDTHHSGVPTSIGGDRPTRAASASVIALMNSMQINLAVRSVDEAIALLNLSFSILPEIIAASGNSRYLDQTDTLFADTRLLMWERTHDTLTTIERLTEEPLRIGLPDHYFADINDYINYVARFPFVLNKPGMAFQVGTGLNWSDARLKVTDDGVILLEFRPVSMQPSVAEDIAICAMYVGLLEFYKRNPMALCPLSLVKANRFFAMRHGLHADFMHMDRHGKTRYMRARDLVAKSLENAEQGLISSGFDVGAQHLRILHERLEHMRVPADEFAAGVEELRRQGFSFDDALQEMVHRCVLKES